MKGQDFSSMGDCSRAPRSDSPPCGVPAMAILGLLLSLVIASPTAALAVAGSSPALAQQLPSARCVPSLAPRASGPQVADEEFQPPLPDPAYEPGSGPRVVLDEAHGNFHTVDGRYSTFARLLRGDGYRVEPHREPFSAASLEAVDVLVIANALIEDDPDAAWSLPTPSAFSAEEIAAVRDWVGGGGSLLLIADHMPFPGAAADLAAAFGVLFTDTFATDITCSDDEYLFSRQDGTLTEHPITQGRDAGETVPRVRTFTGQAFRVVGISARPLLVLPPGSTLLFPAVSWRFDATTPRMRADGMLQGAALTHGSGRMAVFGEAAMFTAQVSGQERRPMGMNMPEARHNPQFLLNVMHWLTGLLPVE